jgi:hypothetical protein
VYLKEFGRDALPSLPFQLYASYETLSSISEAETISLLTFADGSGLGRQNLIVLEDVLKGDVSSW